MNVPSSGYMSKHVTPSKKIIKDGEVVRLWVLVPCNFFCMVIPHSPLNISRSQMTCGWPG